MIIALFWDNLASKLYSFCPLLPVLPYSSLVAIKEGKLGKSTVIGSLILLTAFGRNAQNHMILKAWRKTDQ